MSSLVIQPLGTVTVASLASSKVAVYSKGTISVYQKLGKPNHPEVWNLLGTTSNGETIYSITAASDIRIDAGGSDVLYEVGVNAKISDRKLAPLQAAPGVLDATGALTADMMSIGIVTSTTGAAVAGTVPAGSVMDAAFLNMAVGDSFDWSVIATGANAFTVTAASGHTLVGTAVVATVTSGAFRTRKSAATTYITYRIG